VAHFRSALQATSAVQCRLARGKAPSFQRHLAPHYVALVAIIGTTARKSLLRSPCRGFLTPAWRRPCEPWRPVAELKNKILLDAIFTALLVGCWRILHGQGGRHFDSLSASLVMPRIRPADPPALVSFSFLIPSRCCGNFWVVGGESTAQLSSRQRKRH